MFSIDVFKVILSSYILLLIDINAQSEQPKLSVEILYESLCPDSIRFIKEQLYPVWKELSPYINIKFVPFGKSASYENGAKFICQHGPKECLGNRIQSCVLNALQDQNVQVEYVSCFMDVYKKHQRNEQEFGQSCAAKVGINWDYVIQCHDSQLGTDLQLQAEATTAQFSPKFVPTILYNGKFNQQAQDESLNNFRG
ncbi:hypothetical protein ILUMI_22966, partial [Ignelater luminosus]